MKLLFRATAELKKHYDIDVNTNFDTLKPFIEQAQELYLIPLISQKEFDMLTANIGTTPYPNIPTGLTAKYVILFEKAQRCLAYYTMYKALPYLNSSVGDMGVQQKSSKEGTSQSVAQWRHNERLESTLRDADFFADNMLSYMEDEKDTFTGWAMSASYTVTKDLFLPNTATFQKYIAISNSRRTYLAFRSFIEQAELKYILPAIGESYYIELKGKVVHGSANVNDKKLLPYIERALAYCAYYEAYWQLYFVISADGISVRTIDDGFTIKKSPTDKESAMAFERCQANRDTYLASLKRFINDARNEYPLYLNSHADQYAQPGFKTKSNSKKSGHFRV